MKQSACQNRTHSKSLWIALCSQPKSDQGEKEINFISICYASIFDFICNLLCFYSRFVFLLCFDICVFDVFLLCADTFENRPFYPSSSSFMFYSRSSCFTHFFLSNHKYFFDSTNTYSRTYVLFVLCLHAIFSSRFALAFSAEPILMEINFIGCIFYGI